ncbi:MAG: polysaccharide biosynthesis/export family protein [Gemmataceae bacterium]
MTRPDCRLAKPLLLLAALAGLSGGCAAITNPVADGIPVRRLPEEIFPRPREELKTIPLTLLRQPPPAAYLLAPGDVLGVYIENLLGDKAGAPPVRMTETGNQPPAIGYPIPVLENGTISLPFTDPIPVAGLSIEAAREAVRVAITETKQLLPKDKARIYVTLMQPRRYHVVVVRQDTGNVSIGPEGTLGAGKRGSGFPIDLPAYENDILNALAKTGGLPGLDALNEVMVQRTAPPVPGDPNPPPTSVIRIPLRTRPGEPLPFRPEDVVLRNGDIVFIESRETELFYTAGLLPIGEYVLPRDYDLDVVAAVAKVRGPLLNGGFNQNNQFTGQLVAGGLGAPSPSLLTVLRKTGHGRQLTIRVDLNRAMRDPRERILVQPGDVLVLQEKPGEAIARYLSSIVHFTAVFNIFRGHDANGTTSVTGP